GRARALLGGRGCGSGPTMGTNLLGQLRCSSKKGALPSDHWVTANQSDIFGLLDEADLCDFIGNCAVIGQFKQAHFLLKTVHKSGTQYVCFSSYPLQKLGVNLI